MHSVRDALNLCCHGLRLLQTTWTCETRSINQQKDDWMHHAYVLTKVCEFDCALEVE